MNTLTRRGRVPQNILIWAVSIVLLVSPSVFATPRPPLPPLPEMALNLWRFDHTNWWTQPRTAPIEMEEVLLIESWSGYAAYVGEKATLRFPAVNAGDGINLCLDEGSLDSFFHRGGIQGPVPAHGAG